VTIPSRRPAADWVALASWAVVIGILLSAAVVLALG